MVRYEDVMYPDLTFWVNALVRELNAREYWHTAHRYLMRHYCPEMLRGINEAMEPYADEVDRFWRVVRNNLANIGVTDPHNLEEIYERGQIVARAIRRVGRMPETNDPTFRWVLRGYEWTTLGEIEAE